MAPVIHTPVKGFTGTIAGVHFADGVGETGDAAALLYFSGAGYSIDDEQGDESEQDDEQGEQGGDEPDGDDEQGDESEQDDEQDERPHPVQGSKAVWFEYLTKIKPDHGFDLEKVSRKELIAAVEAIEAD